MNNPMKKVLLFCAALCWFAGTAAAQDIDGLVKKAVDELVARRNTPITVNITPPTVAETASVSAFSRYLSGKIDHYAVNNTLYRVTQPTRGVPPRTGTVNEQKALIQGSYYQIGDQVEITLSLVSDPGGSRMASTSFKIPLTELKKLGLDLLPENRRTEAETQAQEALFADIPAAAPPSAPPAANAPVSPSPGFFVEAWPNEESRTYFDGDKMTISLYADRDCFFKVYQIDVNNQMQLIYPNQQDRDNVLKANTVRRIPNNSFFLLHAPFGEETILAVFSLRQFENLERETQYPVPATSRSIKSAITWRGMSVGYDAPAETEQPVSVRFSYTILPANFIEETFSFKAPADVSGAVRSLRDEVLSQGGEFTGNEREGSYSAGGLRGSYRVSAGAFVITIRRPPYQSAAPTRGAGGAFNFSFDRPRDLPQAVQTVRAGIEGKGGSFTGNEREGAFRASGIAGNYRVQDRVSVSIQEKPFVISYQLIEKEVKNYFGVR
jgi:hypothetical protein